MSSTPAEKPLMLTFWLPVLSEALEETNDLLSRRDPTSPLNGKKSLLLEVRVQCKELLRHLDRLLPPPPKPQ